MSRAHVLSAILVAGLAWATAPGRAEAAFSFGSAESIHRIQDVTLKGANDEALFLGYMTRTQNFLAGLYVEDAGYVLGVRGESKKFYPMPKGDELAAFQKGGYLPDPLPPYSLTFFDYLLGYSLYPLLAIGLLWLAFDTWRKKRKKELGAAAPSAG